MHCCITTLYTRPDTCISIEKYECHTGQKEVTLSIHDVSPYDCDMHYRVERTGRHQHSACKTSTELDCMHIYLCKPTQHFLLHVT